MTTFPTNQDLDPAALRRVFGTFPTGVVAVASEVDGELTGLAASSFTSVSLDPALVSISIANSSKTWPALRRAPRLGITVLAAHHGTLARQLAGPVEHRFDSVEIAVSDLGAAVIADGVAHFDTSIYREVDAGDHTIALLEVHAVAHAYADTTAPLVFHRSAFHRLAAGPPTEPTPSRR